MVTVVCQAYRFALDPTPAHASHAGAARFAYNWGLGQVKAALDGRARERRVLGGPVTEALADGLNAWSESRDERKGRRVGFPRFKRRGRCRESFRYTTGRFGLSGRTRVQLPRIGHVHTHEPTTKLQRKLAAGQARILSATISREGGRWLCSFACEVERDDPPATHPAQTIGVDVGIRNLAVLSTGEEVANPRALERARRKLQRLQRKAERQRRASNPGCYDDRGRPVRGRRPTHRSQRQRVTDRQVTRLHARTRNLRRDALAKLTTQLASTYGTVVVERLHVAGMMRNRRLARVLHDASLAEIRRQLTYKCAWRGRTLIEAPTFYASSKTCSGCGHVKAKLPLSERTFCCDACPLVLDRDENAARNLAALASVVAASGAETRNARSPTPIRPGPAGHRVDREAGIATAASETGAASEQSEAA